MSRLKYTIEDCKKVAKEKGGKCLSTKYTNCDDKYIWKCSVVEHKEWKTTFTIVNKGGWCRSCSKDKFLQIGRDKEFIECKFKAIENGGTCLSTEYINNSTNMEWECEEDHKWSATWKNIKKDTWCPKCAGKQKLTLEECKKLAIKKGGKCLSTEYKNLKTLMEWECKEGHKWPTTYDCIKHKDSWCAICYCPGILDNLETCKKYAETKGGKCLSVEYINKETKMEWECGAIINSRQLELEVDDKAIAVEAPEHGHNWSAIWGSIKRGTWCPFCAKPGLLYTLETVKKYAEDKGGKCLSPEYIDQFETMKFICKKGHEINNRFNNMIQRGDWCRQCAGYKILDLDFCKQIALQRKGKCLSTEYTNKETKMDWKCEHGHTWPATFGKIYHGNRWCPFCYNKTETKVYDFLKDNFEIKKEFKPDWIKNILTGCFFRFDLLIVDHNIIIEIDGRQHFEKVDYFKNDVERNIDRDIYKMKKALENNYSVIRLYQEDVWEDKNNWKEWLTKKIEFIKNSNELLVFFPDKECYDKHKEIYFK